MWEISVDCLELYIAHATDITDWLVGACNEIPRHWDLLCDKGLQWIFLHNSYNTKKGTKSLDSLCLKIDLQAFFRYGI